MRVRFTCRFTVSHTFTVDREADSIEAARALVDFHSELNLAGVPTGPENYRFLHHEVLDEEEDE